MKKPPAVARRGLLCDQLSRSRVEVALNAEDTRHPVLAAERGGARSAVPIGAVQVVVHALEAQIEVGNRGPDSARTNLPVRPARRAARTRGGRTEHGAGGIAVGELAVRAVQRGLPLRVPEVLVARGDAPGLGLVVV